MKRFSLWLILVMLVLMILPAIGQTSLQQITDLRVSAQSTPGMTVRIAKGTCFVEGVRVNYAGGNSSTFTAPTTHPRIDLITLNSAGTINYTTGTEAASPDVPSFPADELPLALIYHRVGETSIKATSDGTNGYIYRDVRAFLFWRSASGGAGGAPSDATYFVNSASDGLTSELVLSALTSNISIMGNQAAARTITIGGSSTYTDNVVIGGNLQLQKAFTPSATGTLDLGSSALKWRDLLLSRNLSDGTNTVTVANLKTAYDHTSSTSNPHSVTLTQAEAAGGAITESAITDGAIFPRLAANESITGKWTFSGGNVVLPTCLDGSKPAAPSEGQVVWATDVDKLYVYDGSDWVNIAGSGVGGGAPTDAEYLVTQSSGDLSAEKVIGSLGATLTFQPSAANVSPITAKGYTSQTADIIDFADSTGRDMGGIDAYGRPIIVLDTNRATFLQATRYAGSNSPSTALTIYSSRGSLASPSALQSGDGLLSIQALGYGATGFSAAGRALIQFQAAENWTDSAHGTKIIFQTTPNGSTTQATALTINNDKSLDIEGKVTKFNAVATEGYGVPAIVDYATYTGRTASIGSTNCSSTNTAGMYEVKYYLFCESSTSPGPNSVTLTIAWNDGTARTVTSAAANLGSNTYVSGSIPIYNASGYISFSTTYSATTGSPAYGLKVIVTRMN